MLASKNKPIFSQIPNENSAKFSHVCISDMSFMCLELDQTPENAHATESEEGEEDDDGVSH